MFSKRMLSGAALTALSLAVGSGVAHAQSTASQVQEEEIIVTGHHNSGAGGLGAQVNATRDQSVVTQEYFGTQIGSSNVGQLINLLPGVTYSSEDYTGVLSGDFRMHGFDGAHISVTIDGSPVNDTGNYAVYPGEYLPSEVTARTTVNMGATEVDSPTASAVGGTVNIVTILPSEDPGFIFSGSRGSYDFNRFYGQIDTGALGPLGTRSFFSMNYTEADKWKGHGNIERFGVDGRIYQPLQGDDFVSVALTYASDHPYFYYSGTPADGRDYDYNTSWVAPTVRSGLVDSMPSNAGQAGADTNFWALHPNPVIFGDIRGQSRFTLAPGLTFTFDPSFFYTLANGGGATNTSETDKRLIGNSGAAGVDLNGDGDFLDSVALYSPSNTNTHRWVLTSSLLWDMSETQHFQLGYTYDYGRHRQTGEFSAIDLLTGDPDGWFGGIDGQGIRTADGAYLRKRDRFSIAQLNQLSLNYMGEFLDDNLHVNIGVRDPHFERDLNEHCYVGNGATEYCDTIDPGLVLTAFNDGVANHNASALSSLLGTTVFYDTSADRPAFRFPFSQKYTFHRTLPNAGVSYRLGDANLLYATYAQGFSAPKTDDLYTSSEELVKPETSNNYGFGYRYQSGDLNVSLNFYRTDYQNRIVASYDPDDASISIDRNVGDVRIQGLDLEAAWRPLEHLSLYGSATYQDSEVLGNYSLRSTLGNSVVVPTRGKQLVMMPNEQFAARAQYEFAGGFSIGAQVKYIGRRYVSDVNDAEIDASTVVDLDARIPLHFVSDRTALQLNVYNLFDDDYISRSSTNPNFRTINYGALGNLNGASGPFVYYGAPRTITLTLRTQF